MYRAISLGNGQYLLAGAYTMEVWGAGSGVNLTGYPFNYISTIYRGIPGPMAIAGDEDGWGKGIFFVGDDNKVSTLTTYTPTPISVPDRDDLIEAEPDKTKITVGVYVSGGHGMVVVQGPAWCWEYDTTLQTWHERQSYLKPYWRGHRPILVFGMWLCGDRDSSSLCQISDAFYKELGNPSAMRIETGPLGNASPENDPGQRYRALHDQGPEQCRSATIPTRPTRRSASRSAGMAAKPGPTRGYCIWGVRASATLRARSAIWGQCDVQGVRWRFDESAGLAFGFNNGRRHGT